MNKFHILLADPPWSYRDRRTSGKSRCGATNHYNCLSFDELASIDVGGIAEENSVLFLWCTWPLLESARPIELMRRWGFQYKTLGFIWVKTNKDGSPFFGPGAYTKANSEICLLGTHGKVGRLIKDPGGTPIRTDPKEKLSVNSNFVSQLITARRGRHSAKPPIVKDKIVELFGDISRVELFARDITDGWDRFGNEIDSTIQLL